MNTKYFSILAIAGIILAGSVAFNSAEAATTTTNQKQKPQQMQQQNGSMQQQMQGTVGTVTAINGTTITMTSKQPAKDSGTETTTTYTIDAANATVTKSGETSSVSSIVVGENIVVEGTTNGTTITATAIRVGMVRTQEREQIDKNTTIGTVTAINGTTITMTSKQPTDDEGTETTTTYTIDAANATVKEDGKDSTISAIVVGDRLMVKGTTSGTTITATTIAIQNNQGIGQGVANDSGEPIIVGTVTAVSGTTITMTNKNSVVYTVDAASAKVTKNNAEISASTIAVGETIIVQGTFSGTTVTATTIVDQGAPSSAVSNTVKKANIFNTVINAFKKFFRF